MITPMIIIFFFVVAMVYASAGFGGGSTYIAVMIMSGLPFPIVPKIGLICNLVVVTNGVWLYAKRKHLHLGRALPFFMASMPMAYLCGRLLISKELFAIILGGALLASGLGIVIRRGDPEKTCAGKMKTLPTWIMFGIGGGVGGLAGLTGIGGGIFLSPILYHSRLGKPIEISAITSTFILVNSISGLMGHFCKSPVSLPEMTMVIPLAMAVLIGGQIGTRMSLCWFSSIWLQRVTGLVTMWAGGRILWEGTC